MTITRYEARWEGTDPKQLRAIIQASQGLCMVALVNPRNEEIVPRRYFGCTEEPAEYLSREISQTVAGMGGANVRVRIRECNDSPTEVEDCRAGGPPGPIEEPPSPTIGSMPGPMTPLMCSPRGMMMDVCTADCMSRLATVRGTRGAVVGACAVARDRQRAANELAAASALLLLAAAALALAATATTNPIAFAALIVIAIILAAIGVVLWIAQSFAQANANDRWREFSAAERMWRDSTQGVLLVCCPECVGDLLTPHACPR